MSLESKQLRAKVRWGIVGLLVLLLAAGAFVFPRYANRAIDEVNATVALGIPRIPEEPFRLGLDLQGGAHLLYEASVESIDPNDRASAVDGVRDVIEQRVNSIGVGEPNVQTTRVGDSYRIIVELPGVTDVTQATAMIGATPILEFKEENDVPPRELTKEEKQQLADENKKAKERVTQAAKKLSAGTDFAEVAKEYSEDELTRNNGGYIGFLAKYQIEESWYEWAISNEQDAITEQPIETDGGYALLKRGEIRNGQTAVTASQIRICYLGARSCPGAVYTKPEAEALAKNLFDQANADNFADLARKNSSDPGSAEKGGNLGTIFPGQTEPAFEQALFAAKPGEIIGPVNTPLGYHIIYKKGEEQTKEVELSAILIAKRTERDIVPPEDEWKSTELSGRQLERAEVVRDPNTSAIQVSLQFDKEGADLFAQLTRNNIGKSIAIFLDGRPISIPRVDQEIGGGQAVITGSFTLLEARELAQRLNTGALPVPVELISQQTVGATLGAESLAQSLKAGIIGMLLVMLFMILYYRLPGIVSVVALVMYISLLLAIFKIVGVTLTLAGIAGVILSIGMAVDANVLIFERLKEELRSGKSMKVSVEEGFARAWTSIRDGNLSTLLIAIILLFSFTSSFVRGFALTLSIGILLSMFTAITVTRVILRFITPWFEQRGYVLFLGRKKQ